VSRKIWQPCQRYGNDFQQEVLLNNGNRVKEKQNEAEKCGKQIRSKPQKVGLGETMRSTLVTISEQGCQIFLDAIRPNVEKIVQISTKLPNDHNIYQMAVIYSKWA
jgi:hypothetical protein